MIFNIAEGIEESSLIPTALIVNGDFTNPQLYGESPDLTGLTFTVVYELPQSNLTEVLPSVYTSVGAQTVTFKYTDNAGDTASTTRNVNVVRIPALLSISGTWSNPQYYGYAPDITGLIFTVTYVDGQTATVTPTSVSPSTWNGSGLQTATFSYTENGTTVIATSTVNVDHILSSLSITTQPTKIVYIIGENFEASGATVIATYNDGTTSDVTSSVTWSPTLFEVSGNITVTASYTYIDTKTTTTTVTVEAGVILDKFTVDVTATSLSVVSSL